MNRTRIYFSEFVSDATAVIGAVSVGIGGASHIGARTELITRHLPESTLQDIGTKSLVIAGLSAVIGVYAKRREDQAYSSNAVSANTRQPR